jgi:acyl carrier protein
VGEVLIGTVEVLAALAEVLQVERSDLSSRRFGDLVADSLEAIQIRSRVYERLGVRLDLAALYGNSTVEAVIDAMGPLREECFDDRATQPAKP